MANIFRLLSAGTNRFEIDDETGVACTVDHTDGSIFIPVSNVLAVGGTWTATRIADNDVVLRKTAAADTTYLVASLRPYFRTTTGKGVKVKSIAAAYSIGTANLTSQTATISAVTYANNTAVAVAAHGGTVTGSLATATQAQPYLSTLTLGTQSFVVTANVDVRIQIAIVAAATSAYDFYGFFVNYNYNNL